jgi:hypothetical protein
VLASRPTARSALAFLELLPCTPNAAFTGCLLLGILDPTDELIAGQGRDVLPRIECRGVGDQRLTQVRRQLMYDSTGHSLTGHRSMVIRGRLRPTSQRDSERFERWQQQELTRTLTSYRVGA